MSVVTEYARKPDMVFLQPAEKSRHGKASVGTVSLAHCRSVVNLPDDCGMYSNNQKHIKSVASARSNVTNDPYQVHGSQTVTTVAVVDNHQTASLQGQVIVSS